MKHIAFLFSHAALSSMIVSTLIFYAFAVPVDKVEAGGGGLATEPTQLLVRAEATISAVQNTITASASTLTAGATTAMWAKENLLDGIGWAIAKQLVSRMTASLIDWINSGFEGSPAFILDLKAHLVDALDTVAGEYIESLGGIGELICSPFRLDVQAALSINYAQARSGMPSGPTACTLSGIGENIETFLAGGVSSWDQWFQVTANPQNTPYGAYLEAEAKLNARLVNEAGKEIELAKWGDGFLSKKVCETPQGGGAQQCSISTPGKVISEALTFQLSTGPRSLIEADEINEIIGALMNQLVNQVLRGANGLLGLGGGNPEYADPSYDEGEGTFLDQLYDEIAINEESAASTLESQAEVEQEYLSTIDQTIAATIRIMGGVPSNPAALLTETQRDAYDLYQRAIAERAQVQANLETINGINAEFNSGNTDEAVVQYTELYQEGVFSNGSDAAAMQAELEGIIREE